MRPKVNAPAGSYTWLPAAAIDCSQNTHAPADSDVREKADSIAAGGLNYVPEVWVRDDGTIEAVDGHRRIVAMRDVLGCTEVPVRQVTGLTEAQVWGRKILANAYKAPGPLAEAQAYRKWLDLDDTLTSADIDRQLGKQTGYAQRRLYLLLIPHELATMIDKGQIGITYAEELAGTMAAMAVPEDARNLARTAFGHLRDEPRPTIDWWRELLGDLQARWEQCSMFDGDYSDTGGPLCAVPERGETPGLPGEDTPPAFTGSAAEVLRQQADWWTQQADLWRRWPGSKAKQQACKLAATLAAQSADGLGDSSAGFVKQLSKIAETLMGQGIPGQVVAAALAAAA